MAAGRVGNMTGLRYMGGQAAAPKRGPQAALTGLLRRDMLDWTQGYRAAELIVIPKRSRTYFGDYKPGSAQRIPSMIPEEANYRRVRETLVARSRLFRSITAKQQRSQV